MKNYFLILFLFVLVSSKEASTKSFLIRSWQPSCQDTCVETYSEGSFINSFRNDLYIVEHDGYQKLFVYLREGDSLALSLDDSLGKITCLTNLQPLALLAEQTMGYQHLVDDFILYRTEKASDFMHVADSMIQVRLKLLDHVKNQLRDSVPQEWWDAEYSNIITFPLSSLNYFLDDPELLKYGEHILNKIPNLPQNLLSKQLLIFGTSYINNYLTKVRNLTIANQPDYYEALSNYFREDVLEYSLAQNSIVNFDFINTVDGIDSLFNFVSNKVSNSLLLNRLKAAKEVSKQRRVNFFREQVSLFNNCEDIEGKPFQDLVRSSFNKEVFIMISAPGCPPCVEASSWLSLHHDIIKGKADIFTIIIGGIERFKKEQEKSPYPWPVLYDVTGEVYSKLPRRSVPQYFLIQNGQLIHQDAPKPQEYFSEFVINKRE